MFKGRTGQENSISFVNTRDFDQGVVSRHDHLSLLIKDLEKRIVFVEANTNCLPLGWVMFITLLRRDPHLNQVKTESSQTLISKVNHGATPAVDISFY